MSGFKYLQMFTPSVQLYSTLREKWIRSTLKHNGLQEGSHILSKTLLSIMQETNYSISGGFQWCFWEPHMIDICYTRSKKEPKDCSFSQLSITLLLPHKICQPSIGTYPYSCEIRYFHNIPHEYKFFCGRVSLDGKVLMVYHDFSLISDLMNLISDFSSNFGCAYMTKQQAPTAADWQSKPNTHKTHTS